MPKNPNNLIEKILASSFVRGMSVYMLGNIIISVIPFLLMPVMTRFLTPNDYGIVGTAIPILQLFVVLQGINASGLIARGHFDNEHKKLSQLVSTATWIAVIVTGILFIIIFAFGSYVERWTKFPAPWLPIVIIMGLFTVVGERYLVLCQARKEPGRFIAVNISQSLLDMGLSVLLVVGLSMNWQGRLWAKTAGLCLVSLIALYGLVFRLNLLRFTFSRKAVRSICSFGVPLIPHVIGGWVMTMSARFFLNEMVSVSATGLYFLAFNLASPVMMVIGAANRSYMPALFEQLSRKDDWDRIRFCRILLLVAVALPAGGALYGLSSYLFLPILAGPRFQGSAPYVFWLSLMASMHGVYYIFANFVVYTKRTKLMIWRTDLMGGLVLLISCPILIHLNGGVGAAQAGFLGMTATTLGCITAARQAYPMPWKIAAVTILRGIRLSTGKKS